MWYKYDSEKTFPSDGIYMFELQAIADPRVKITTPCDFKCDYRGFGKHLIHPILDGPGGLDYNKFKPTHFFVIPKREDD